MQRPADELWRRLVRESWGDAPPAARRLRVAILILGAVLVVGAIGLGAINATSQSTFCASCHEMQPEYVTWQASSHSEVECIDCHVGPGWTNLLKDKVNALRQVYGHVTGNYEVPITLPHPVEDYICQQCHPPAQQIQQKGELIIPHDKHQAAGVNCLSCHQGIAHAQVSQRGLTTGADWESWTPAKAQEVMVREFTAPQMETCLACHQQKKLPVACDTCHTAVATPENHTTANWLTEHGAAAVTSPQACLSCHLVEGKPPEEIKSAGELAQNSALCQSCHSQRPAGHTQNWVSEHREVVAKEGMEDCLVCHAIDQEQAASAGKVYCNQCHQF